MRPCSHVKGNRLMSIVINQQCKALRRRGWFPTYCMVGGLAAACLRCSAPIAPDTVAPPAVPAASTVPGSGGNCCVNSLSPGCDDPDIEACVCASQPSCCDTNWGLSCVGLAITLCNSCPGVDGEISGLLGDSDGDGLTDLEEIIAALDPLNPYDGIDVDGDGIPNGEDFDVDGDGIPNAYDIDVDGDGELNFVDDDIDGDGLLNALLEDDDDDGDGIDNLIDNDDDADGFPDREDDDDDDDDGDDDEECESNRDCTGDEICDDGECIPPAEAATRGPVSEVKCSADEDCEGDEVCFVTLGDESGRARPEKLCMKITSECSPLDDEDGDGVCDEYDPDPDGDGDLDDDDDGLIDRDEIALGTDPDDFDSDGDFVPDGRDFDPLDDDIALPDTGTSSSEGEDDADEGSDAGNPDDEEDDQSNEGQEGSPETGDLDLSEDDDGAGLPVEPDGDDDGDDDGSDDDGGDDNEGDNAP